MRGARAYHRERPPPRRQGRWYHGERCAHAFSPPGFPFSFLLAVAACGEVTSSPVADAGAGAADAGADAGADAAPESACPNGMALIPGGSFTLAETGAAADLDLMDITHVTSADYDACETCAPATTDPECNAGVDSRGNDPANCVDRDQAASYCAELGKSLPDEEHWEWAARGGEADNLYAWGDEIPGDLADHAPPGARLPLRAGAAPLSRPPQEVTTWSWPWRYRTRSGQRRPA
jgi:hypothetical protein